MKKALIHGHTAYMVTQFNMDNIAILQELGYEVDVACCFNDDDSALSVEEVNKRKDRLSSMGVGIIPTASLRKIFAIGQMLSAYNTLKEAIETNRYEIVHTMSPIGGVVCRLAARSARKKYGTKVIYAAHGFHFFKGAPKKNWLIYFQAEKFCARFTDLLITINHEDYENACNRLNAKAVKYIPGVGVDTKKFAPRADAREKIRKELGIADTDTVLLSVGELIERKNHKTAIEAISMLKKQGRLEGKSIKYLIAGRGRIDSYLRSLIKELDVEDEISLIGYRSDIWDVFAASDIYVFPSHQEGLPVALMEAMSCYMPVVAGAIRGNVDLIHDGEGGFLVPDTNSASDFADAIERMLDTPDDTRKLMGSVNKQTMKGFDKPTVNAIMREVYEDIVK